MDKGLKKILIYITPAVFVTSAWAIVPVSIKAYRSGTWPKAEAVIKKSGITDDWKGSSDPKYFWDMEYEYNAGGKVYVSSNYGTQTRFSSRSEYEVLDRIRRYPADTFITIAYDPENHARSRIQTGLAWYHLGGLLWVLLSAVFFMAAVLAKTTGRTDKIQLQD